MKLNLLFSIFAKKIDEIKNPEITKKISIPMNPPLCFWEKHEIRLRQLLQKLSDHLYQDGTSKVFFIFGMLAYGTIRLCRRHKF